MAPLPMPAYALVFSHSYEFMPIHRSFWMQDSEADDESVAAKTGTPVYGPGDVMYWHCPCEYSIDELNADVETMHRPVQVDAKDSTLVVDFRNDRLEVMRADGTWSVIDLDRTGRRLMGAVWCNASLYVANND